MSIKSAQAFLQLIKENEDLAKKLSECRDNQEKINFARKHGFDFTEQEFKDALVGLDKMDYDLLTAGGMHVTDMRDPS